MTAPAGSSAGPVTAILAGGLATRLRPVTSTLPKSMVLVCGEPFIVHQLRNLAEQGFRDVVICCGHLGEQIEAFVGDGADFGCRVRYSYDGDRLLGTGGALRGALPFLGERFLVLYGDSYLREPFAPVWRAFLDSKMPAMMTVFRNENRWDRSNVEFRDGAVLRYDKTSPDGAMQYIDYGLGCLSHGVLLEWSAAEAFDLADVYRGLARRGELAGFEVKERFYEIGSHAGLAETEAMLSHPRRSADPA